MVVKYLAEQIRLGNLTYKEAIESRPDLEERLLEVMIQNGLGELTREK